MSALHVVVAVADNGVIGHRGDLPWRLPADLRHFRAVTMGHPIIMGRRTWESIGRPLPGRTNIVISSRTDIAMPDAEVYASLGAAQSAHAGASRLMIIGGAKLYAEAVPRADVVHLTEVHGEPEGDTFFPGLNPMQWREVSRQRHGADSDNEYDYSFVELVRRDGTL